MSTRISYRSFTGTMKTTGGELSEFSRPGELLQNANHVPAGSPFAYISGRQICDEEVSGSTEGCRSPKRVV
jgi:hypothetical protein